MQRVARCDYPDDVPKEREDVLFIRVPEDMKAQLERRAEADDLKVAQLVRRILREWLERQGAESK